MYTGGYMIDQNIFNPGRKVDLFCGKPLLVFHDTDITALEQFCTMITPWERCTRIVLTEETIPHVHANIVYVDHQTLEEIASWYASADCVITHEHCEEVEACGVHWVFDVNLLGVIIDEISRHTL
jgi:hypothetical protein